MFEELKDKELPDWELEKIGDEINALTNLSPETRKLMTVKMLKALTLDVIEGRVEALMIGVIGHINEDQAKHFQWVLSDKENLLHVNMALEKMLETVKRQIALLALERLTQMLKGKLN
jgi:hypothetical protein